MGYLKEFLTQIENRNFHKFLVLWEEYCTSESVEPEEFSQLLRAVKASELTKSFGQVVEMGLPLWKTIQDDAGSYEVLRLLIDLETTNSSVLADVALEALKKRYPNDPNFSQWLRLTGLRGKDNFQGALSKYDLLAHMAKGNSVFHTGGWGTGEIMEVSFVREHLLIEFENVAGRKDLSFANAFKTLTPLPKEHFLARRFSDPDSLEKEGRENPVGLIKLLLSDLGPKTAGEIKDELCELVIPDKDWTKWWQGTRTRVKKDPMIDAPESAKEPFRLRKAELSLDSQLDQIIQGKMDIAEMVQMAYSFVRDMPAALKDKAIKQKLQDKFTSLLQSDDLSQNNALQICILLEQFFGHQPKQKSISAIIQGADKPEELVHQIEIVAFKKRALVAIKEYRKDWIELFLSLLFSLPQAQLREYLLKELNQGSARALLEKKLAALLADPLSSPEMFIWYFQKLVQTPQSDLPYHDKDGQSQFFEAFLMLYRQLETLPKYRELLKKMTTMLSGDRYALVRQLLQGTTVAYTKEFILLASKCQTLTDHDMKILRSLAEVVHPALAPAKQRKGSQSDQTVIWTTEEGLLKTQERIRHIGTVEMIENAREIEAARALGDLRENSEFKFAQERRARLQSELKMLSDQLGFARVITEDDIHPSEVGIGSVVEVVDAKGKKTRYAILGPWDANADENVLSFQSLLAQAMVGRKKGEKFNFKDEQLTIASLKSYFG